MMLSELELEVADTLGEVWHVGFEPDAWSWVAATAADAGGDR